MKIAKEGIPFILVFTAIALISLMIKGWVAFLFFLTTVFMLWFFRDPKRQIPEGENILLSPADGKIIVIQNIFEGKFLKTDTIMISIFMSPMDVHINRSPFDGTVQDIIYTKGKFISAFKKEASLINENISMILNTRFGNILVKQIAGFIARRVVCRVTKGDILKKGQPYGIIKFSSRVDMYLPANLIDIKVSLSDKVRAGETVIGQWKNK